MGDEIDLEAGGDIQVQYMKPSSTKGGYYDHKT